MQLLLTLPCAHSWGRAVGHSSLLSGPFIPTSTALLMLHCHLFSACPGVPTGLELFGDRYYVLFTSLFSEPNTAPGTETVPNIIFFPQRASNGNAMTKREWRETDKFQNFSRKRIRGCYARCCHITRLCGRTSVSPLTCLITYNGSHLLSSSTGPNFMDDF